MAANVTSGTRLSTEPTESAGVGSVWQIDEKHSLVQFSVRHMMLTTVRGRFNEVRGTIHCPDESDPTKASVEAFINAASIDTGDEQRDAHLRGEEFLDVDRFPIISFKSRRIDRRDEDEYRMVGDLTIKGVTREVVLQTTFNGRGMNPWGQEVAGFTAETSINRKDFGLKWNVALESGGLLVGDKLNVLIEIQAIKQS
jgi:polyisoprenoid-binding protein YceI